MENQQTILTHLAERFPQLEVCLPALEELISETVKCYRQNGTFFVAGNGGCRQFLLQVQNRNSGTTFHTFPESLAPTGSSLYLRSVYSFPSKSFDIRMKVYSISPPLSSPVQGMA